MALPPVEFRIERVADPDGTVRLTVHGEIDIATAGQLRSALDALRETHRPVRLDLSQIGFVDSSGLAVLIAAKHQASRNGWSFELDQAVTPPVQRLFEVSGVDSFLWR